jgi:hypothetical protein
MSSVPWSVVDEPVGRDEARADAVRELADSRYAADDPPLLQRLLRRALDEIGSLLDGLTSAVPGGWFGVAIGVVLFGAVLAALLTVGRRVLRERAATAGVVLDPARSFDAADHERAADEAEGRGEWSLAVAERFRAAVRRLEEEQILPVRASRTADEAAHEVAATGADALAWRRAARSFDAVVFGGARATAAEAAAIRALPRTGAPVDAR